MRPANGSAMVLKTNAAAPPPSTSIGEPRLAGRGHALDEQVEQRNGAEVLRRDTAEDREDLAARHRILERVRDLFHAELLAVEVSLHEPFVGLHDGVEQLHAVLGDGVGELGRDLARRALLFALRAYVGLHV